MRRDPQGRPIVYGMPGQEYGPESENTPYTPPPACWHCGERHSQSMHPQYHYSPYVCEACGQRQCFTISQVPACVKCGRMTVRAPERRRGGLPGLPVDDRPRVCERCGAHLGAQNPGWVCDTCKWTEREGSGRGGYTRATSATPPEHRYYRNLMHEIADAIEQDLSGKGVALDHEDHYIKVRSYTPDVDVDLRYNRDYLTVICRRGLFEPARVPLDLQQTRQSTIKAMRTRNAVLSVIEG